MASDMMSMFRQLLPQFLIMMVIYLGAVALLTQFGIDSYLGQVVVALVIAFGYPALLRYLGRAPPIWQHDRPE